MINSRPTVVLVVVSHILSKLILGILYVMEVSVHKKGRKGEEKLSSCLL